MTASKMLAAARADLGMAGRPNQITRGYASRNGSEFLSAAWCDQAITEWARESGNAEAVLPEGDRAYTVWHAEDGEQIDRWYAGTAANVRAHALPGAVMFFDWDGTDSISRIDHVGLVEVNLGDGRVQTIEANTGDAVKRRVRGSGEIAGFWNPNYAAAVPKNWTEDLMKKLPLVKAGSKGVAVKRMFYLLISQGPEFALDPKVHSDVEASPALIAKLKAFQKKKGLTADGECGELTWPVLVLP